MTYQLLDKNNNVVAVSSELTYYGIVVFRGVSEQLREAAWNGGFYVAKTSPSP